MTDHKSINHCKDLDTKIFVEIASLQHKVDEALTELACFEAKKANLEVAKRAGALRPASSARMSRLHGLIKGAKLRHSNAEKRLNEALLLHQQAVPDALHVHGPQSMVNAGEGSEDTNLSTDLPPATGENLAMAGGSTIPPNSVDEPSSPPGLTTPVKPKAVQTIQPLPVSDQHLVSLKHIDRSEEDEDDSVDKDINMNLMTLNDKTELQQELFESRFTAGPCPKKKTKYQEISEDSDMGDSDIFYEDGEERGPAEKTKLLKVVTTNAPIAGHPESSASNPESKGKTCEGAGQGGQMTATAILKGKGLKKGPRVTEGIGASNQIQGVENEEDPSSDRGHTENDYHATDYSMAKASRKATHLDKQRGKLADEATHRQFAMAWLDARSREERPAFPPGIDLIRFDPDYLPDVATADYHLTTELLSNHCGNYLCIPHTVLNRKIVSHVDNLEGPVRIWGTPLPRNQNRNAKTGIPCPPHHFHCGCHEKVALAGFVMWKTWQARSRINGKVIVEGLHKHKAFSPREVLFILQFLKSKFGYTVEDMFTGSSDAEEENRNEAEVMKKVVNFCARRYWELIGQDMMLDTHFPVQEEEFEYEWI